jgi:hypothetical protein
VTTYNIPSLDSNGASSLAGTFGGMGVPFTLTPAGSGYNLETDSASSSTVESMLRSSGITGTAGTDGYGTLAGVYGNADTSNEGANASATTGQGLNNNGSTDAAQSPSYLAKYGADGAAIVVGVVFVAGSVYGMMTK